MLYLANRAHQPSIETQRALHSADGYLYFGLADEALLELSNIGEAERYDASVMLARVRVLLHLRKWADAETLSSEAITRYPDEDEFPVQRAFALHQLQRGEQAAEVILSAPEWIRRTGILHYNLACYEARLGDLSTARQCIDAAIQINAAMKKNARIDPDLQALWN